jgi:transcription elongation factor SPT5
VNSRITAAFIRECFPGHIYIEALSPEDVRRSLAGMSAFVHWREGIILVPIQERVRLLDQSGVINNVRVGDWVRVKRGLYWRDLGCVLNHDNFTSRVTFAVVPRLDYIPDPKHPVTGTKRPATRIRPSQALLDIDRARKIGDVQRSKTQNGYLKFHSGAVS